MEKETNKFSKSLEIFVKSEGRTFSTSVYRRKTSIGRFTQYNSFEPFSNKIGFTKCFIHRAFKISGSYLIFHNDINKVKNTLQKSIYPIFVIDSQEKIFLEIQYTAINNKSIINNDKKYISNKKYFSKLSNQTLNLQ